MLSESLHKVQTMYMVHAHECTYLVMHVPMQLSTGQHFFPGSYIGVHDVCKLQCIHHTCIVSTQYKLHKLHWCNDQEAYLSLILTSLIQPVSPTVTQRIPTIDRRPGPSCFCLKFSSGKATSPYMLEIPVPSPYRETINRIQNNIISAKHHLCHSTSSCHSLLDRKPHVHVAIGSQKTQCLIPLLLCIIYD